MIIVLDTNVLVSAHLSSKGAPAIIVNRWQAGEFEIATSPQLIVELEHTLNYPHVQKYIQTSQEDTAAFINQFRAIANVVEPQETLDVIEDDPDDNRVVECALAGGAAYIVSGDKHLLNLQEYNQIIILEPRAFLAVLDHLGS